MNKKKNIHPYILIILTFIGVIFLGTLCLVMPFTTQERKSIGFVDALFQATSAVCVTGLSVYPVRDFSLYGKVVMVILMEIGGLSFITIAMFFFTMLGAKIGVSSSFMLRESLNQSSVSGLITLVRKIMLISFTVQIICAVINFFPLKTYYDGNVAEAIGVAIFHSAASFNNAGFDVFKEGNSMIEFADYTVDNVILNCTTIAMIILGSMGFIVIDEVLKKRKWRRLSLHSKLAISTTILLILIGTLLLKITVHDKSFNWLQALFASVTTRTAGFTTYDFHNLKNYPAAYILIIVLMLIGASPCSTGGGVKTTTFGVFILAIIYFARGKKTRAFHRKISDEQIFKSFVLIGMCTIIVLVGSFLVGAFQPNLVGTEFGDGTVVGFDDILFEVASAFSTAGLSMGITTMLNPGNRILLCFIMFFGRLGPLTIIGVVNKNWMSASKERIQYVEEGVIIG